MSANASLNSVDRESYLVTLRRFPPPWSVEDIGVVFKVCNPERPRASIPASRITGGAVVLVPTKTGCYRLGFVALGVPFWPLKCATHIGDSSMR
jgi:hypothetical protein